MSVLFTKQEILNQYIPAGIDPAILLQLFQAMDAYTRQEAIKFAAFIANNGFDFDMMGGYIESVKGCPLPFAECITEEEMYDKYKLHQNGLN